MVDRTGDVKGMDHHQSLTRYLQCLHVWERVDHIVEIATRSTVKEKDFQGPSQEKAALVGSTRPEQTSRGRLEKGIPLFSSLPSHLSLSPHISSLRSLLRRPLFASNGSSQSHPQHLFPKHQSSTGEQLCKSIEHSPILSRGAAAVRSAVPSVPARFSRTKSQRRPSVLSSRPSRFFSF